MSGSIRYQVDAMPQLFDPNALPPQFFIVGAPRCGTTALSTYLAEHPQVCFSEPKEPHYFTFLRDAALAAGASDDPESLARRLVTEYFPRFFPHWDGAGMLGDGSVSYLYSPPALSRILSVQSDARFIVMLRNPLDMLPSYHAQLLYTMDEDVTDFATAWRLQEARAEGRDLPADCRSPDVLRYRGVGSLGHHLEEMLDVTGREPVHIVVYDDFRADPADTYRQVLSFLDLADDGRREFPRVKASRRYRSRRLHRLLKRPPNSILRLAAGDKDKKAEEVDWARMGKRMQAIRAVRSKVMALNRAPYERPPLDPAFRRELAETFMPDIDRLSEILGRDLSHWYAADAGPETIAKAG